MTASIGFIFESKIVKHVYIDLKDIQSVIPIKLKWGQKPTKPTSIHLSWFDFSDTLEVTDQLVNYFLVVKESYINVQWEIRNSLPYWWWNYSVAKPTLSWSILLKAKLILLVIFNMKSVPHFWYLFSQQPNFRVVINKQMKLKNIKKQKTDKIDNYCCLIAKISIFSPRFLVLYRIQ